MKIAGSMATRYAVASHLTYQAAVQRADIVDPNKTQTQTIAILQYLVAKGYHFEVTAIRSDHHDDSGLGTATMYCGTHAHGWGVDGWPLNSNRPGDYMDPASHAFREFLRDLSIAPFIMQIGLAGTADRPENHIAATSENVNAGPSFCFDDSGSDHVHIGSKES